MPRDSRDRSPDSRDRGRSGSPKRGRSGSPKRDDRDRSGSPKRDRSGSRARSEERPRSEERREPSREREGVEIMKIDNDSAAFVLGRGGSTKRKIERVSETKMDLDERAGSIEIFGTDKQRQRARDYVNFVDQQRKGAVVIEVDDRDDVTVVSVPEDCCGFVMGRQGATLRSMEEEWGTLMCFAKVGVGSERQEKLCIFGSFRARRGAELKVMSAVEHKRPGHCTRDGEIRFSERSRGDVDDEGWDVETKYLGDDDFSYALGAKGSTRRKLAAAAGCIIEYVGRLACMAGYRSERNRAHDYLKWLLEQRKGHVSVVHDGRDDVNVVDLPTESIGFITGHKGMGLREVESRTGTFIFTNGTGRGRGSGGTEELLVFGHDSYDRKKAAEMVEDRVDDHKRMGGRGGGGGGGGGGGYGGGGYGGGGGGGGGRGGYDDRRDDRGRGGDRRDDRRREDSRDRGRSRRDDSRDRDRRRSRSR